MTDDALPVPCQACPWRLANQGKRHPDGWYTKANLQRLWAGLRRGEDMSCHPTDPANEVSEAAQAAGYRPAPEHAKTRECVGAAILKGREAMVLQTDYDSDITRYRRGRPRGLTRDGVVALIGRYVFGGTALGGRPLPKPDLDNAEVGYEPLGEWKPMARDAIHTRP